MQAQGDRGRGWRGRKRHEDGFRMASDDQFLHPAVTDGVEARGIVRLQK